MNPPLVAIDARLIGRDATGDSTYWSGLVLGLSRLDTEFRFLLFSNAPKPASIPENERFRWIELPSRRDRWWSLFRYPLKARRMGARVLHAQYNLSPLAGSHGVTTIHDVSFLIEPGWFRPIDRVLLSRFVPASAHRAARVITVSETSRKDIVDHIAGIEAKIRVTPLAANPAIEPIDREIAAAQVLDELNVETPYLLTVGTRWPRKNLALAVDAIRLLKTDPRPNLVVTGKPGWGEEEVPNCCQVTGYVTNGQLSALYSAADLFLVPSKYEGFGLTVLEAFACGCPVICSVGGALPEVAGKAAKVIASWEPADWSKEIDSLLVDSSKLKAMRLAGASRAASFRWEATAQKTVEVYREVIE